MNRRSSLVLLVASLSGAAPSRAVSTRPVQNGFLIEAEDFHQKVSSSKTFATATQERAASGRQVLARFFEKGYVTYRFEVPSEGVYAGWLRYGSKGRIRLGVALDPLGKPAFKPCPLQPTGGYVGRGVWGWAELFRAKLAAGEHVVAIRAATMRPDCLFISPAAGKPTDDVIRSGRAPLSPETLARLREPLVAVHPNWLDGSNAYRLPAWYGQHRVHAHTRLSTRYLDKDVFFRAAEGFRQMGVRVFVRHIKTANEGAWWPSKVGAVLPAATDRNLAKEIIDNAHKQDCRIIVYHRHMEDEHMAKTHPDWVCRNWRGKPLSSRRGDYMCFNSPYPDYFLQRALELVDLGADGFYFDEQHMPKTGCWCAHCRKRFKAMTGLDHPARADPDDPLWHKLIDFNNLTIEQTFLKWRQAIHERNPEVVMLIGSNTWPTMADRHMTDRLFRIADAMKTEFSLPARSSRGQVFGLDATMPPPARDAKIALGYTLARDAADGRPAHVWTHNLRDETAALYAVAGMVTHGCIANLDVRETTIPNAMFKPAFALGERISPHFAGMVPLRWAAIHYSELARDRYATSPSDAWRRVLYPTYGAYLALLRAHLPVGIVTDSQLEEGRLDGFEVLFLPAPDQITDRMRAVVGRFKERGGLVVEQSPAWRWHASEGDQQQAIDAFMQTIRPVASAAPLQVFGGPAKMHTVGFVNPTSTRLTVSLANDFSWVETGRVRPKPGKDETRSKPATPPPPCRGVRVVLRRSDIPRRVHDAVSGTPLTPKTIAGGVEIAVPTFRHMAVVVAEYADAR